MASRKTVKLLPAGVDFECEEDETILAAAIRHGFSLPYGCRKGNCGTCKAQVLEGEVDLEVESVYGLGSFEIDQGFTLLCSAYLDTDATIEMEGLDASSLDASTEVFDFGAEIVAIEQLTADIRLLRARLDTGMEYRSGQFAELRLPGTDVWRTYSMASPAHERRELGFVIKLVADGVFSTALTKARPGDRLEVRGPLGSFWIRDHARPILMVGGGAGMGPLWGMLQDLASRADPRPIRMFYGARTGADLLYLAEIAATGARLPDFAFVPALSEVDTVEGEGVELGLITDVVARRLGTSIPDFDAYLCGPPGMIDAALDLLTGKGLVERKSIFYDKFTAS